MTSQQPTNSLLKTAGIFLDRAGAESAQQALIAAGIPAGQLSIETSAIDPNPPLAKSRGVESAKGGALLGATFGGLVAVLLSFSAQNFPGDSPVPLGGSTGSGIVIAVIGLAAGALAGALLGLLSGSSVPRVGEDSGTVAQKHLLMIQAAVADLDRVRDLVREQGGEIQI